MKLFRSDLHIHTVLSPCADLLMTPGNIIKKALERNLDLIAITDHNSAENVEVAMKLAKETPLRIIPGMEVESREEVHLLCLFDQLKDLLSWQEIVYESLLDLKNDEDFFGVQLVTDLSDEYVRRVDRLLAMATSMTVKEIVEKVSKIGGLVIPAHIDRLYNSIITNLGFIPLDLNLPILEISRNANLGDLKERFPFLKNYAFIRNSDSHYLNNIKPMTGFWLKKVNLEEISLAAKGEKERKSILLNF